MSTGVTTTGGIWRLLTVRSLFGKIFLWFWLAMLLVTLTLFFIVWATPPDFTRFMPPKNYPGMHGVGLVEAFEQGGAADLREMLEKHPIGRFENSWVFDENGKEVLGRTVASSVQEAVQTSLRTGCLVRGTDAVGDFSVRTLLSGKGRRFALVSRARQDGLEGRAPHSRTGRRGGPRRGGGPPRGPLDFARHLERVVHFLTFGDMSSVLIRLLVIFATTFLLCYGLARYLTNPIVRLRGAAHQIACGQLGYRIEHEMHGRQDELAELAHDFDVMAGRVEELLAAQRRLLGDISHELRTPLTRMKVSLELAREGADEELQIHIARIEREAERLQELISRVVTLVRLDTPEAHFHRSLVDVTELVEEVAADAELEARTKDVTIERDCRGSGVVLGSRELLRRAVENVIRNAIRHSPSGETVEVTLSLVGEDYPQVVRFVVRDHGPGVPEDQILKLFEPFYRCEAGRERATGGVGLGLAITERSISFHSGSVIAENVAPHGLRIVIDLPLAYPDERTTEVDDTVDAADVEH